MDNINKRNHINSLIEKDLLQEYILYSNSIRGSKEYSPSADFALAAQSASIKILEWISINHPQSIDIQWAFLNSQKHSHEVIKFFEKFGYITVLNPHLLTEADRSKILDGKPFFSKDNFGNICIKYN